jgi:hypothetical protein
MEVSINNDVSNQPNSTINNVNNISLNDILYEDILIIIFDFIFYSTLHSLEENLKNDNKNFVINTAAGFVNSCKIIKNSYKKYKLIEKFKEKIDLKVEQLGKKNKKLAKDNSGFTYYLSICRYDIFKGNSPDINHFKYQIWPSVTFYKNIGENIDLDGKISLLIGRGPNLFSFIFEKDLKIKKFKIHFKYENSYNKFNMKINMFNCLDGYQLDYYFTENAKTKKGLILLEKNTSYKSIRNNNYHQFYEFINIFRGYKKLFEESMLKKAIEESNFESILNQITTFIKVFRT